jgi:hypothetical protein
MTHKVDNPSRRVRLSRFPFSWWLMNYDAECFALDS